MSIAPSQALPTPSPLASLFALPLFAAFLPPLFRFTMRLLESIIPLRRTSRDAANRIGLYAASTARRDTRRVDRFRRSPPIRDENTEQISFPSRHDRQSDHADRTTPGHFHPNMTWCGTRRNNGERQRKTKRCKMAVPINQRWPHQRMLRKTSHCVAEPLPHNADLGHFHAGVAMRSSFRSQRDNTRAQ